MTEEGGSSLYSLVLLSPYNYQRQSTPVSHEIVRPEVKSVMASASPRGNCTTVRILRREEPPGLAGTR